MRLAMRAGWGATSMPTSIVRIGAGIDWLVDANICTNTCRFLLADDSSTDFLMPPLTLAHHSGRHVGQDGRGKPSGAKWWW